MAPVRRSGRKPTLSSSKVANFVSYKQAEALGEGGNGDKVKAIQKAFIQQLDELRLKDEGVQKVEVNVQLFCILFILLSCSYLCLVLNYFRKQ
jgi:hypothetical protein